MRRSVRLLPLLAVPALVVPLATTSQGATKAATYQAYVVGTTTGEPSIGYDPRRDTAMYVGGTKIMRLTWDLQNRMRALNVSPKSVNGGDPTKDPGAYTDPSSLDPIGYLDPQTGRFFNSQLALACSVTTYTDDLGATWHPTEGCGPDVLLDHQSTVSGPYRSETRPAAAGITGYPNAVYYCAQDGYGGRCARSDDGGVTFGPGVPAYNHPGNNGTDPYGGACSAIHGHLRIAPDGVVYLPHRGCGGVPTAGNLTNSEFLGGGAALSVSEDNGLTWTVRKVPGAHNQEETDPSVAADKHNAIYFGWQDGTNPPDNADGSANYGTSSSARIAVSKDHGRTWSKPYDVSTPLGIKNVQFPEVIAGDAGRAAFAWLGTKTAGDDQHHPFMGIWHLYISTTIDGGKHWSTVDTTPNDPVQRGCIWMEGTSNKNVVDTNPCDDQRNMLDFNDITLDRQGRVLVAYTDGCVGPCVTSTKLSKDHVNMVMRQTSGPLLYVKGSYSRR
ncbi:MAG TPA: sialidase family protein [Mycobacteriales bacterium]|nr:sialidase family protein [Mycobacteriales bacterium]